MRISNSQGLLSVVSILLVLVLMGPRQAEAAPAAATLVSPSGSVGGNTTPTYTWNAVSNATWYRLWVDDSVNNQIKQWYPAADVGCGSGTGNCSITPTTELAADGEFRWWIQTWNSDGSGPWSTDLTFYTGTTPPTATLVSPSGLTLVNMPTYTWNAVAAATWYLLWVNDANGTPIIQWYTATEAGCDAGAGTCSVTPTTNVGGDSTWWIRTWNPASNGEWSSGLSFTTPLLPPTTFP